MAYSSKFRGLDTDPGWINRKFARIERQVRELRAAKSLQSSSIGKGGLRFYGGGGILIEDGGGITITDSGVLDIADGKIINDMLAEPVKGAVANGFTDDQGLPLNTWSKLHEESIPVPAGFATALVFVSGTVGATADGSGSAGWQARLRIEGVDSAPNATVVAASMAITLPVSFARLVSNVDAQVNVSVWGNRFSGGLAGTANGHVTASVMFLR